MKKITSALTELSGALIGFLFLFGTIFGAYHGFKKHDTGTGFMATFMPPYAWYLAAEGLFWHDDFAHVDWDIRIKNDTRSAMYLIAASTSIDESNLLQYQEALEAFTVHIKDYPADKKKRIEDAAATFIKYSVSAMNDMSGALDQAVRQGTKPIFAKSAQTKTIEAELAAFDGIDELIKDSDLGYKALQEAYGNKEVANLTDDQRAQMINMLSLLSQKEVGARVSRFKDIFGHEPDTVLAQ